MSEASWLSISVSILPISRLDGRKAFANFGLKRYDQAIELARQAIAINPNYVQYIHATLVAALALTGHDAEARQGLQRYLALPSTGPLKTIAAWKAYYSPQGGDPPRVETSGLTTACARQGCWRSEATRRRPARAGAIHVARQLAGLFGLGSYRASLIRSRVSTIRLNSAPAVRSRGIGPGLASRQLPVCTETTKPSWWTRGRD
jgi:hypothetical protein